MATTSIVGFCPKCKQEVSPDSPTGYCVFCGYVFERPTSKHLSSPRYLFYQIELHRERLSTSRRQGTKPPTKEEQLLLEEIEKDFKRWQIEMHADDRIAALTDALGALRHLVASKTFGEDMKRVIDLGKRVGALAATIEDYVKHGGGLLHAREIGPIPPDSGNGNSSAATAR